MAALALNGGATTNRRQRSVTKCRSGILRPLKQTWNKSNAIQNENEKRHHEVKGKDKNCGTALVQAATAATGWPDGRAGGKVGASLAVIGLARPDGCFFACVLSRKGEKSGSRPTTFIKAVFPGPAGPMLCWLWPLRCQIAFD